MKNTVAISGFLSLCIFTAPAQANYHVEPSVAHDLSSLSEQLVTKRNITLLPPDIQQSVVALAAARNRQLSPNEANELVCNFNAALKNTARDGSLFERLDTTSAMDFADLLIRDILALAIAKKRPLTALTARVHALIQDEQGQVDPVVEKALTFFKLAEELLNPGETKVKPLMYYCDKLSEVFRDVNGNVVPGLEKLDEFFTAIRSQTKFAPLPQIFYEIFGKELNDPIRFAEQTFRALLAVDPAKPYALYCDKLIPLLCDDSGTVKPEFTELHSFLVRHRTSQHLAVVLADAQELGNTLQMQHQSTLEAGSNQYLEQWNQMISKMSQQYNPTAVMTALQRRLAANKRYLHARRR